MKSQKKPAAQPPEYAKVVILYLPSGIPKFGIYSRSKKFICMEGYEVFPEYWADIPT